MVIPSEAVREKLDQHPQRRGGILSLPLHPVPSALSRHSHRLAPAGNGTEGHCRISVRAQPWMGKNDLQSTPPRVPIASSAADPSPTADPPATIPTASAQQFAATPTTSASGN